MTISVGTLSNPHGFVILGEAANDQAGYWVSEAGDINNDGTEDFVVGAQLAGGNNAGAAYVIFGDATGYPSTVDLGALTGADGFKLTGAANSDRAGRSVSGTGDVNDDGIDDLVVGAWQANNGPGNSGRAYVVYGKATPFAAEMDLGSLSVSDGFTLEAVQNGNDYFGWSVSEAGDFNDDNIADFIVGAWGATVGTEENAGTTYVVFGSASGYPATLDLTTLSGTDGFRIDGVHGDIRDAGGALIDNGDNVGYAVASVGDLNNDGVDDIAVGANRANGNGDPLAGETNAGEAYVIFGDPTWSAATFDLATLNGSNGFRLDMVGTEDRGGYSLSHAGDMNGDGIDDVIVSARLNDNGGADAGEAYVVFGSSTGFSADLDMASLNGTNGFTLRGENADDWAGSSVDGDFDFNGDGLSDLLVGANRADTANGANSGRVYVIFGQSAGFASVVDLSSIAGDPSLGLVFDGRGSGDQLGRNAVDIGDINGDSFDDIVMGAEFADPNGRNNGGEAYVVYGFDPTQAVRIYTDDTFTTLVSSHASFADAVAAAAEGQAIDVQNPLPDGDIGAFTVPLNDLAVRAGPPFDGTFSFSNNGVTFALAGLTMADVDGTSNADVITGSDGANKLVGKGGTDTLIGMAGDDLILGGGGNDSLRGGTGNDTLIGSVGADTINGGSDTAGDTLSYSNSALAVTVNLATNTATGGDAIGDVFSNIENVFGSSGADSITGDGGDNVLSGFNGNDTLIGGSGDDLMVGGSGNDSMLAGVGADTLDGGAGTLDVADYSASTSAVVIGVNNTAVNSGGLAEGDVISGATEHLIGSDYDDAITGNTKANILEGGDGNDTMNASSNNDTLNGGDGDDLLLGSRGADFIDGGAGSDTASYSNSDLRVNVDLLAGLATGSGHGAGDTLTNIENVFGSRYDDTITGDNGGNRLQGFNGDDIIFGGLGADTLEGGNGDDSLVGGSGDDMLIGNGGADVFTYQQANFGDDTVTGFANGIDLIDMSASGLAFSDLAIASGASDTTITVIASPAHVITLSGIGGGIDINDFIF